MSKSSDPFSDLPKDKGLLPQSQLPMRRIQRIVATPTFKLVAICIFMFLGIRWVIEHNHESDDWPGRGVKPTTSVESFWVKWDKKQYIQVVADEEKLCSAVMVWHDIESIGSRARR